MYKSNIITQAWVYLMITLAKQRAFVGKRDMIYDCPSETVPEQFFGAHFFFLQLQCVFFYYLSLFVKYQWHKNS